MKFSLHDDHGTLRASDRQFSRVRPKLLEQKDAMPAMSMVNGKTAAYVCENFTCKAAVTDPKALAELLKL